MNVGAEDKGTGKSEKITITNDKGRLTEEQIEKMIKEAEQFADEDKKVKERVDAKNAFDGYLHSMRSAAEGSGENKGLSEKLDEDEKEKIMDALKDGQSWLDSNPEADAEDKATGKSEKITITNDKGRLTEEQIEKMIKEAEQFADEDKKVKERVDAKNA